MKQPKNPFHPGEILLEEFLEPAGITQTRRTVRKVPYRLLEPIEQLGDPKAGNHLLGKALRT
jgi:hypothetical protein